MNNADDNRHVNVVVRDSCANKCRQILQLTSENKDFNRRQRCSFCRKLLFLQLFVVSRSLLSCHVDSLRILSPRTNESALSSRCISARYRHWLPSVRPSVCLSP